MCITISFFKKISFYHGNAGLASFFSEHSRLFSAVFSCVPLHWVDFTMLLTVLHEAQLRGFPWSGSFFSEQLATVQFWNGLLSRTARIFCLLDTLAFNGPGIS